MGVHAEQVTLCRPVAQPRPGRDPRQRGVPALARHIGRRRQPEGARSDEGEAVAAEAERRKFALVLPVVARDADELIGGQIRSEEHTSELQSLMRSSYAVFCLKK